MDLDRRDDEGERAAATKEHGTLRASRRKNDQDHGGAGLLVAMLFIWLGKLTLGATTGQNNFKCLTQRRRPVAGDPGLYAGRGNRLNGGPICRSFSRFESILSKISQNPLLAAKCQSVLWSGFESKGWYLGDELVLNRRKQANSLIDPE
jgi:hypothetical protein